MALLFSSKLKGGALIMGGAPLIGRLRLMFIFFNIFTEWKYVTADIEHDSLKKLYVMSISARSPSE